LKITNFMECAFSWMTPDFTEKFMAVKSWIRFIPIYECVISQFDWEPKLESSDANS